jgi:hypothetical protein
MAPNPHTAPITMPAMDPGEMNIASVAASEELLGEGCALVAFELADEGNTAHPSLGGLEANPSMGCAYACATDVVATKGARFVEPLSSYLRIVTVDDTVRSL